jgi:hypothetical protein
MRLHSAKMIALSLWLKIPYEEKRPYGSGG